MHVTQDLNSFEEIIAHAQCSVDEKKNIYIRVYHIRMFPTTRNMQMRVHVYRPRHYCGD
jgi:hypothetical protein